LSEHLDVEPEKSRLLAKLSRGGIGWAISASQNDNLLQERYSKLSELQELSTASLEDRFSFAGKLAAQYSKSRESVEGTLNLWLEWWRDLLLARAGQREYITNIDQEEAVVRYSEGYSLPEVRYSMEAIRAALEQLSQNANARLVLEVLMLSIPNRVEERTERHGAKIQ
jgi:DNA polymerase-3 subunit delta'